ncbi:hypothetical protein L207DRAFT_518889 [Hyaloscypha variabilis F]|uniref:Zn(2)-C6 fungal-type domain-containing protein n=1 Tax=Hyaloscypha variabilis (strain UAMH 11265 / GT02V1 / F) TaxID=1149755 RepID=A0A2J6R0H0_HYAVF|nr:hypothetical protein L207DRAFT_518889 [Hyaloscypha variabilis F]
MAPVWSANQQGELVHREEGTTDRQGRKDHDRPKGKVQVTKKRFHHKSKKGCGTCKIRRVKCDEARPICRRCVKADLDCDGYGNPDENEDDARQRIALSGRAVPGSSSSSSSRAYVPLQRDIRAYPSPPSSVGRSPSPSLFKNDQEKRYFQEFSSQTAGQLTGLFSTDLWKRLILQVCETHPSVRYAVIALGALDPKSWRRHARTADETRRRQFAYHEYSLAIADMRSTISQTALDLRSKLIACIICVCFEIYHFNKNSAIAQIRAMSSLIEEQDPKALEEIDDEILDCFYELQIQALIQSRYAQTGPDALLKYRRSIRGDIPREFSSMRQARQVLRALSVRQLHWTGSSRYGWPWHVKSPQYEGTKIATDAVDPPPNEFTSNEEWCLERNRRFIEFTAWSNSFQPLFIKARRSHDPAEFRRAIVLKITYLYTYLTMMVPMLSLQESYYGQTARLTELLTLCKALLLDSSASYDSGFAIEANLLIPLGVLTYRFRHRKLRREACELCIRYPRREGLWDGKLLGNYCLWLAELEEEDLGEGEEYVPHDLATELASYEWDTISKTCKLSAYKKYRDPPGRKELREAVISWE